MIYFFLICFFTAVIIYSSYKLGYYQGREDQASDFRVKYGTAFRHMLAHHKDHRHCFSDQEGHEKHLRCCLCEKPNPHIIATH